MTEQCPNNICDALREKDPKRPENDFWIMIVIN